MRIKSYIIHVLRSSSRADNVNTLLESIPGECEIINGIDGIFYSGKEIDGPVGKRIYSPFYPFSLSVNEVACFLSHRAAWSAIVRDDVDAGLVLEDDARLTPKFLGAFNYARDTIRGVDFIRFPHRTCTENGEPVSVNGEYQLLRTNPIGLGMVTQLVSRDAAIRLLKLTERFDRPVDTFLQMHWVTGIRPHSVCPSGIEEISHELGGSLLKRNKGFVTRVRHEILRPIYRNKIRKLSAQLLND